MDVLIYKVTNPMQRYYRLRWVFTRPLIVFKEEPESTGELLKNFVAFGLILQLKLLPKPPGFGLIDLHVSCKNPMYCIRHVNENLKLQISFISQ